MYTMRLARVFEIVKRVDTIRITRKPEIVSGEMNGYDCTGDSSATQE